MVQYEVWAMLCGTVWDGLVTHTSAPRIALLLYFQQHPSVSYGDEMAAANFSRHKN